MCASAFENYNNAQSYKQDDICPTTGKSHEPDWNTISVENDGNVFYVDIRCADCGRSGCLGESEMLKKDISW